MGRKEIFPLSTDNNKEHYQDIIINDGSRCKERQSQNLI